MGDFNAKSEKRDGATSATPRSPWLRWMLPLLLLAAWVVSQALFDQRSIVTAPISYSNAYEFIQSGKVESVSIEGQELTGKLAAGEKVDGRLTRDFSTVIPEEDRDLLPLLREKKVDVTVTDDRHSPLWPVVAALLPWTILIGVWVWMARRAQGMMGGQVPLNAVLKGRARRFERQDNVRIRFDDVAGLTSAKRDLVEVVDFLRQPARFARLGGKLPRGVLLVGPPGTGKTLLARAVAGEAEAPFFYVNGSEFIQLFVGVGASRVRELFDEAKRDAPSIVFIDEIDAVGRSRGAGLGGGNDEREQTLNQLLSEMDGFSRNDLTVVIAATNRPDILDPALLRPGRFDRRVVIDRPECSARVAILRVHTKYKPLAPDVALDEIAQSTPGFSGADLANLCNEAAISATRRGANAVAATDFASAMDKIVLGDPRETLLEPAEKRRVAIHESGHAVVARFSEHAEPLRRVSILPRGMSLGATQQALAIDRHLATEPELLAKLRVLMGGYAAERMFCGSVSSGSEDDLKQATEFAFRMVAHYGMSEKVGPMFHEQRVEHPFLGQRLATGAAVSDATAFVIENESRRLLTVAADEANRLILGHREVVEQLVAALLERETLDREDLDRVFGLTDAASAPSSGSRTIAERTTA